MVIFDSDVYLSIGIIVTSHYFSKMAEGREKSIVTSHYFSKMAEGREKSIVTSHYFSTLKIGLMLKIRYLASYAYLLLSTSRKVISDLTPIFPRWRLYVLYLNVMCYLQLYRPPSPPFNLTLPNSMPQHPTPPMMSNICLYNYINCFTHIACLFR